MSAVKWYICHIMILLESVVETEIFHVVEFDRL